MNGAIIRIVSRIICGNSTGVIGHNNFISPASQLQFSLSKFELKHFLRSVVPMYETIDFPCSIRGEMSCLSLVLSKDGSQGTAT